ncbi:hypothetical protein D3C85_1049900 [compost metagenome]
MDVAQLKPECRQPFFIPPGDAARVGSTPVANLQPVELRAPQRGALRSLGGGQLAVDRGQLEVQLAQVLAGADGSLDIGGGAAAIEPRRKSWRGDSAEDQEGCEGQAVRHAAVEFATAARSQFAARHLHAPSVEAAGISPEEFLTSDGVLATALLSCTHWSRSDTAFQFNCMVFKPILLSSELVL